MNHRFNNEEMQLIEQALRFFNGALENNSAASSPEEVAASKFTMDRLADLIAKIES